MKIFLSIFLAISSIAISLTECSISNHHGNNKLNQESNQLDQSTTKPAKDGLLPQQASMFGNFGKTSDQNQSQCPSGYRFFRGKCRKIANR